RPRRLYRFEFGTRRAGQDRAGRLCRFRVSNHPGRAGRCLGARPQQANHQERRGKTPARAEIAPSQKALGGTPGVTCQQASPRGCGGRGCVICDGVGWHAVVRVAWWVLLAAIFAGWWSMRPADFATRWVSLPPAMSWEMLITARKAAERPTGLTYTYCKYPN